MDSSTTQSDKHVSLESEDVEKPTPETTPIKAFTKKRRNIVPGSPRPAAKKQKSSKDAAVEELHFVL